MLPEFVAIVDASQGLRDNRPLDRRTDQRLEKEDVFSREGARGVLWNVAEICVGCLTVYCLYHSLFTLYLYNRIYSPYIISKVLNTNT